MHTPRQCVSLSLGTECQGAFEHGFHLLQQDRTLCPFHLHADTEEWETASMPRLVLLSQDCRTCYAPPKNLFKKLFLFTAGDLHRPGQHERSTLSLPERGTALLGGSGNRYGAYGLGS